MYTCKYCDYKQDRPQFYHHNKGKHPEMIRPYKRSSSTSNSSNSSAFSARPLLLLDAPPPAIVGNKRHHYENQEESLDVVEISSKDLKKETVQKLLVTAEESYSNGYTYRGVYQSLTDKVTSQDTITLRPIFSEMQNKRLQKKLLAQEEMNKTNSTTCLLKRKLMVIIFSILEKI